MCILSGSAGIVREVASTNIFARPFPDGRQALVYSMTLTATEPVAMILPLPVPPSPGDDAVQFVDLSGYADFFRDLDRAFEALFAPRSQAFDLSVPESPSPPPLKVHPVGSFEASFVPTRKDFERLEPRFRLDPSIWDRLPEYADFGFAVFQLRTQVSWWQRLFGPPPTKTIHPMAFLFPRRDPTTVYFPTRHVHDGELHERAHFDHHLFLQQGSIGTTGWTRHTGRLEDVMTLEQTQDLVDPELPCFRRRVVGMRPNQDILLAAAP